MKQKDLPLILVVGFMSAVFALLLSHFVFNNAKDNKLTAEVVAPITTEFKNEPGDRYFNQQSIDPTQLIRIGDSSNTQPFKGQ